MRTKRSILLYTTILLAGTILCSCIREERINPGPQPGPEGEGYLVLTTIPYNGQTESRSGQTASGISPENKVSTAMFILYDGLSLTARYIHRYEIADDGTVTSLTDSPDNLVLKTGPDGAVQYIKTFPGISRQDYRLAVVLNGGTEGRGLDNILIENGNSVAAELSAPAHSAAVFSSATELTGGLKGGNLIEKGIGSLTALDLSFPSKLDIQRPGILEDMRMVMTNADGLIEIPGQRMSASAEEAALNPVEVRVERAVAKVALFKGFDPDNLKGGAKVADFGWACDIFNNYMYLIRQPAAVATSQGGGMETAGTPQAYRYARDPNFDGQSNQRTGNNQTDLSDHFFTLPRLSDTEQPLVFHKSWNACASSDPAEQWTAWEYVTENTMAAEEQYQDVTTRIVIRCNYIPPAEGREPIPTGEGYFFFNGRAIDLIQMELFYDMPFMIAELVPELAELEELLTDPEFLAAFGWTDSFEEPAESMSLKGLSYYKDGISYYAVPIRHFDDAKSPDIMGYGRFGVVRNNVYRIRINDITGPGSITIPDPGGPDEESMDIEIIVGPWTVHHLVYEL